MICAKCFTRMDACQECADAELAAEIAMRDAEIARLRAALKELAVQVSVHFDKRYTGLTKDEHGEICYFNDILNHLEQYTKEALEAK